MAGEPYFSYTVCILHNITAILPYNVMYCNCCVVHRLSVPELIVTTNHFVSE